MKNLKLIFLVLSVASFSFGYAQVDSSIIDNSDDTLTRFVPQFSTTIEQLDDESENQDVSGLLQSSRDVYTSIAGFNFGVARFRIRGYDADNFTAMMNGVTLNDPEMGRAIWAYWVDNFLDLRFSEFQFS